MAYSVTLPELGESVTEGTVTRWLKQEGDTVEVDEPLLEISTDKVDTEVPSPVAGTVVTGTVSPSWTMISTTVPEAGDGTSVSTLSVEISTIVSSASIRSPTCFAQRVIVPSDTLTPIWGITTSTTVPVAMGAAPQ